MREGDSSGTVTDFGSIDLQAVRSALASYVVPPDAGGPTFAAGGPNPFQQEFTVQLEVRGEGIAHDRASTAACSARSPTRRSRRASPSGSGAGGEAATRYADLDGDNIQELIVPTEDGTVHAYKPDGSELKGWPVHTGTAGLGARPQRLARRSPRSGCRASRRAGR